MLPLNYYMNVGVGLAELTFDGTEIVKFLKDTIRCSMDENHLNQKVPSFQGYHPLLSKAFSGQIGLGFHAVGCPFMRFKGINFKALYLNGEVFVGRHNNTLLFDTENYLSGLQHSALHQPFELVINSYNVETPKKFDNVNSSEPITPTPKKASELAYFALN